MHLSNEVGTGTGHVPKRPTTANPAGQTGRVSGKKVLCSFPTIRVLFAQQQRQDLRSKGVGTTKPGIAGSQRIPAEKWPLFFQQGAKIVIISFGFRASYLYLAVVNGIVLSSLIEIGGRRSVARERFTGP